MRDVPYVGKYFQTQPVDPQGNLHVKTADISSRFVENTQAGRLFVITGKVKNDYVQPRSLVRITGKLYAKDKRLVASGTVSGGNVLADMELMNLDLEAIQKRLSNPTGSNQSNVRIAPGAQVPFMIVFSKLPEDLEEFTVQVASSIPAN